MQLKVGHRPHADRNDGSDSRARNLPALFVATDTSRPTNSATLSSIFADGAYLEISGAELDAGSTISITDQPSFVKSSESAVVPFDAGSRHRTLLAVFVARRRDGRRRPAPHASAQTDCEAVRTGRVECAPRRR